MPGAHRELDNDRRGCVADRTAAGRSGVDVTCMPVTLPEAGEVPHTG